MKLKTVVYYFLILHFLEKGVFTSVPYMKSPIFTLIRLQMDYCFNISMCTISMSVNSIESQPAPNCCKACSCETDCMKLGNCCPDFSIAKLINGNNSRAKSNTISDLSDRLQNQNLTLYDINLLSSDETFDTDKTNLSCVRSKAKNKDFHSEEDEYPQAYEMVTTCPKDFNDTDDIRTKCGNDIQLKQLAMKDIGPDLSVPMTSLKTNYTYKNEYCLLCNEGYDVLDDVIRWKVIFTSLNAYHVLQIDDPYALLKIMNSNQDIYGSNIIYQPSNNNAHLLNRCSKVDVKACPDDTDKEIETLCRSTRHYLPVISKSRTKVISVVYNNIACYLCNNRRAFKTNCENTYLRRESYSLQLNFLTSSQNTILLYNSSEHQLLNISFTERDGRDMCEPGFIPIFETDLCRQTICPMNFYLMNGECIPTFNQMTKVSFTVALEVIRAQKLQKDEKGEFYRVYTDNVERIADTLSVDLTYSLWKLTDYIDAITVTLTKHEPIYRDLLQNMSAFLTKITLIEIKTKTSTIEVITSLFHYNSRPRLLAGKFYPPLEQGRSNVPLKLLYSFKRISNETSQFIIDKAHLCYRVNLDSSDVNRDKDGTILLLNNTNRVLTFVNTIEHADFSYTACIDEVNEHIKESYMFGGYTTAVKKKVTAFKAEASKVLIFSDDTKDSENTGKEFPKELVLLIVFAAGVSFVCLSQFYIFARRMRNSRN